MSHRLINVLMVGAGEYNCGYVPSNTKGAAPDKKAGVTAIVLFDLRRRGKLGRVLLADAIGTRLPGARATMKEKIGDIYS
jgi:D-galacturonate reductase